MKYYIITILLLVTALIISSCSSLESTSQPEEPLERFIPNFQYQPASEAVEIGSAGITVALQRPAYQGLENSNAGTSVKVNMTAEPFPQFSKGLEQAIDNILLNKGMLVKGPYNQFEEIVYSEKREIDLYLVTDLELNANNSGLNVYQHEDYNIFTNSSTYDYSVKGTMSFGGNIYMRMESAQGTLLWKKQLPLEQASIQVESEGLWNDANTAANQFLNDTAIYNEVAKQLEKYYASSARLMETYINAEEFNDLKKQLEADEAI